MSTPARPAPMVPHLEQYLGLWTISEPAFNALAGMARGMDLAAHVRQQQAARPAQAAERQKGFDRVGNVAVLDLVGFITKYGSSLSAMRDGTVGLRRRIREAAAAPDVDAIVLRVDSPGGTAAGTGDLADEVFEAAQRKPLAAFIEDLGASGAYWVAAQATLVAANPTALVGCIGTYAVIEDVSGWYAERGIKTHVIRAGQFKGAGVEGTEVTPDQLAEFQRQVDSVNREFLGAVARGRKLGLPAVQGLADGRVYVAADAKRLGLVDFVGTLEAAIATVDTRPQRARAGNPPAAQSTAKPVKPAKARTPCEVDLEYTRRLQAKIAAGMTEAAARYALEDEDPALVQQYKAAGLPPVVISERKIMDTPKRDLDPIAEWDSRLAAKMRAGMPQDKATSALVREDPELHRAYLAAYNARHGRTQVG